MTPRQLQFIGYGVLFVLILAIMIIRRKNILAFLYPNRYVLVEMLELDNGVNSWIQEKNEKLRFMFNNGYYNMYHQTIKQDGSKGVVSSIYRDGRLAKFYYHEGFSDPIDFRQGQITGNPQIARELEENNISSWFDEEESGIQEFIKKYGWIIIVALVVIVLILMFKNQQVAQPVVQVVKGG